MDSEGQVSTATVTVTVTTVSLSSDTSSPTPSPMTWAGVPAATDSTSIIMTATIATSSLPVANHSISATYGGDSTYAVSASAPSAYSVTPKNLTVSGVTAADKIHDGTANTTLSARSL